MSYRCRGQVFDGRALCFPNNTVPDCEQSACANQIGASTIAVTSDDYLVIVEQGPRSNIAKGLLASSGSGSADWNDVAGLTDLQQFVKHFALRELTEECGLKANDVAWCKIMGYGRLLDRGGLPQFFCLAKLNCAFRKIHVTRSERTLTDYHNRIYISEEGRTRYAAIQDAVSPLRRAGDRVFSSLWWSLEMLSLMSPSDMEDAFSGR